MQKHHEQQNTTKTQIKRIYSALFSLYRHGHTNSAQYDAIERTLNAHYERNALSVNADACNNATTSYGD